MSAASKISRLAVGDPTLKPSEEIYDAKFDAVKGFRNEQLNEDLPFGSQGGMSVQHYFPVDGEYSISLRFVADLLSPVNGLAELPTGDVYFVKKFVPAGLHTLGAAAPRSDVKPEIEVPAGPRGLASAATTGRSSQVVMDLFLDRERLQRFDVSKGPSTLSRMVIRGPFNVTDRGNTASRTRIFICRPTNSGRGGGLRPSDSDEPGTSRVPPTRDQGGHRPSLRVLPDGTHRCRFRHRYRRGAPRHARRPRFLVQDRAGSRRRTIWTGVSRGRRGSGVSFVVLSVEQHPRRGTARGS